MRLEILDSKDNVLSARRLGDGLTLVGQGPGAHVHLAGQGVGSLHVAIKGGAKPVVMDLGGPTPLKVDGKKIVETVVFNEEPSARGKAADSVVLDIGSRRLRLVRDRPGLRELRTQTWKPLSDGRSTAPVLHVRLFARGMPIDAVNTRAAFELPRRVGLNNEFRVAWLDGREAQAQLPAEWLKLGGHIQIGKDKRQALDSWAKPVKLEHDVVIRVFAGPYVLELLVSAASFTIGRAAPNPLPPELRKPFAISAGVAAAIFLLWFVVFAPTPPKPEEPVAAYARTQNIPMETLPDSEPQAPSSGGAGGATASAPTAGQTAASATSSVAAALTGGLRNLIGNVVSHSKSSDTAVVAESGVGAAAAAGAPGPAVGKLSSVGSGTAGVAGAAKLGNLAIAGSGKGFGGGSGLGLGSGVGQGVGQGVGNGIGKGGGLRIVEEDSFVDGGLDKSVIAAVIQNNLSQIKYCYERQLVAQPDLFGKVVVSWVINANGAVESAVVKQTTLESPPVEHCMLGKIGGWNFPKPKNGTKVNVVYPFLFKSTE